MADSSMNNIIEGKTVNTFRGRDCFSYALVRKGKTLMQMCLERQTVLMRYYVFYLMAPTYSNCKCMRFKFV